MDKLPFNLAFLLLTVSMSLSFGYAASRREHFARWARLSLVGAFAFHLLSLIIRTIVGRQMPDHDWYVPYSNWFESFSLFAFVIVVEYLVVQWRRELPILGAFIIPLSWACLMTAVHSPTGMEIPLQPPTFQSFWMSVHVPFLFLSYAGFAIAFGIGLAYLLQERQLKARKPSSLVFRLPALDELDHLIYLVLLWAISFLTIGLVAGVLWANEVWGRYWSWDPKETWALLTWLIYIAALFTRLGLGWRGRRSAYLSMIGFIIVLFTYVGVNYMSDLHGFLSLGGQ